MNCVHSDYLKALKNREKWLCLALISFLIFSHQKQSFELQLSQREDSQYTVFLTYEKAEAQKGEMTCSRQMILSQAQKKQFNENSTLLNCNFYWILNKSSRKRQYLLVIKQFSVLKLINFNSLRRSLFELMLFPRPYCNTF